MRLISTKMKLMVLPALPSPFLFVKMHLLVVSILSCYSDTDLDLFWITDIPPFVLQKLPEHMAHLCPIRALAIWIAASRINKGYLFPNIDKRDRPITAKNTAMVKYGFYTNLSMLIQNFIRNQRCSCSSFGIIYGTWISHRIPTVHIPFAVGGASGSHVIFVGQFGKSASGVVGARTSHT